LARSSGQSFVRPGDVVYPDPELVIVHDGFVETAYKDLTNIGYRRVRNPERVMFVTDHEVIYTTPKAVERGQNNRRIAAEWGVGHFYDVGRGGHGHIFPIEEQIVRPGMVLFAYDMHCTNFGAIGAYALRAGPEVSAVLATGTLWTVVPETLRVSLRGNFRSGVHGRDLGFKLSHGLTSGALGVAYDSRLVEFAGEAVRSMPIATRVALCNTLTEIGVSNILFPPKAFRGELAAGVSDIESDADARFEGEVRIDLADLEPQVALPGRPDASANIAEAKGQAIQHAFLGSCGSGMYEDFEVAADIMAGRSVAQGVRFFIVPGSVATAQRLAADGIAQRFTDAGAIMLPPGCGPCAGGVSGPLGPGERSISTAATNGAGRMGSDKAEAYLGSPLSVAAAAVTGRIVDPRELLAENVRGKA
jgi:3-isopropylmalate/(R)-2-methylmalate dehydratase large subunit